MRDWIWVATRVAVEAHREQLIEHGGGQGVRDLGLLDSAMARELGAEFGAADYVRAYRSVTAQDERAHQLDLVQELGESLCGLVKIPLLSVTLSVMRAPARLAGLGELQQFLERGFHTFRKMQRPQDFVAAIVARERAVSAAIYADPAYVF